MPPTTKWLCVKEQKKTNCQNPTLQANHLSMHFFHVENESILVQTPNGKNILYDCGTKAAANEIHTRLKDLPVNKLDVMIASHAHSDHAGGFYWLSKIPNRAVTLGDLYDNGEDGFDNAWFKDYVTFRDNLPDGGGYYPVNGEKKLNLDSDVDIRLYVNYGWDVTNEDSRKYRSVWMKIGYKDATILFEGDSKSGYETKMIKDFPSIGKAHLLKLSEHGSEHSTKETFLKQVEPVFVVICNKHHEHLPSEEVLRRLKQIRKISEKSVFDTKKVQSDIKIETDGISRSGKITYKITLTPSN